MEVKNKKQAITGNIKKLIVGESFSFPISRTITVRQMIVNLQFTTEMRYSTSTDREAGIIKVTRIQ